MASADQSWAAEEYGVEDGGPDQHSDQHVQDFDPETHLSGDAPDNATEDDGADYDPESVTLSAPAQTAQPAQPAQPPSQSKPKVFGGFLVEVSDDEDEDEAETSQHGAQAQGESQTAQPSGGNNGPMIGTPADAPSNATPALASLDPTALLEARVKQDPRGDMDAWLNLIADRRRQNRLDEARSVYNRFLGVFPQAVSNESAPPSCPRANAC